MMRALGAWLKRLAPGGDGSLRVVHAVMLGGGARLIVVEFDGARMLVGQSRTGLVRLDSVERQR